VAKASPAEMSAPEHLEKIPEDTGEPQGNVDEGYKPMNQ